MVTLVAVMAWWQGRSGAFMYYTHDRALLVKTVDASEAAVLRTHAPAYVRYMTAHPSSFLTRFYGLYSISMYNTTMNFVVMANIFAEVPPPQRTTRRTPAGCDQDSPYEPRRRPRHPDSLFLVIDAHSAMSPGCDDHHGHAFGRRRRGRSACQQWTSVTTSRVRGSTATRRAPRIR